MHLCCETGWALSKYGPYINGPWARKRADSSRTSLRANLFIHMHYKQLEFMSWGIVDTQALGSNGKVFDMDSL